MRLDKKLVKRRFAFRRPVEHEQHAIGGERVGYGSLIKAALRERVDRLRKRDYFRFVDSSSSEWARQILAGRFQWLDQYSGYQEQEDSAVRPSVRGQHQGKPRRAE